MDLDIGDKVFYTKSTGLRVPAKVVGCSDEGYVDLLVPEVISLISKLGAMMVLIKGEC